MGKSHVTINFVFHHTNPEIGKIVDPILASTFDTTVWIGINNRDGLSGEYMLLHGKGSLDNVTYEGFNFPCTQDMKTVDFPMD